MDASFALVPKGAPPSAKPSGARGQSGLCSTAAAFLWEYDFTLPLRPRSGGRKNRWPRSESGGVKAVGIHDKSPREWLPTRVKTATPCAHNCGVVESL